MSAPSVERETEGLRPRAPPAAPLSAPTGAARSRGGSPRAQPGRRPLLRSFPDPRDLEEEIRVTVLHELAHYFGIDEDRLDELGYA